MNEVVTTQVCEIDFPRDEQYALWNWCMVKPLSASYEHFNIEEKENQIALIWEWVHEMINNCQMHIWNLRTSIKLLAKGGDWVIYWNWAIKLLAKIGDNALEYVKL